MSNIPQHVKAYSQRKKHENAVIAVYSPQGINGEWLFSAAADQTIRSKKKNNWHYYSLESQGSNLAKWQNKKAVHFTPR